MCIISCVPKGLALEESIVKRMWNTNSDGAGFMYAEDGQLHVEKGFMTLDAFLKAYEPHAHKGIVLHFRIKTHGALNEVNTHPFLVNDDLAFAHNGVIQGFGSQEHSDTWHFNEEVIKPLQREVQSFLHIKPITQMISDRIGWSKLVFMNNQGEVNIINKEKGDESSDGIWFSNSGWRAPKSYSSNHFKPKSYYDQKKDEQTPAVEQPTKDELQMGDFVWLIEDHANFKRGALGFINWFAQGHAVACSLASCPNETHYIPLSKLIKARFGKMTRRIGHLQEGDYVLIEHKGIVANKVYDCDKDKGYEMHKDFVVDCTDNLDFNVTDVPWMVEVYDNMLADLEITLQ